MGYIIDGIEYDYHSGRNQAILDRLVNREVYCCMTSEVEFILNNDMVDAPFSHDDVENHTGLVCGECYTQAEFIEISAEDIPDEDFEMSWYYDSDVDDYVEGYECPVCGEHYDNIKSAKCCCKDSTMYKCEDCGKVYTEDEYEDLDSESREVYEWWAVSGWFGIKLREQGCPVIDCYDKCYWGREATGQSISLDGCVLRIARSMKILEGMENEWLVA